METLKLVQVTFPPDLIVNIIQFVLSTDLLTEVVLQGQLNWGVTYTSTHICAIKGSRVDIHCTYTYPSTQVVCSIIAETIDAL